MAVRRFDLIVVGMGSGGSVATDFAASLGLKVCAVERSRVGGDCQLAAEAAYARAGRPRRLVRA